MINALSLSQLNRLISEVVKENFPETYWLIAETSDVRVNHSNGHCYLEFIEKNESTGAVIAKARGYIWNNTFRMIKPYFEETTKQSFTSGLKTLVRVGIDFHELYGYGLTVYDIDPTYTLGDLQRKRQEIINRLEEDGILTMNKELDFPSIPQRIAIISSPTAAGYEDFSEHLSNNKYGFVFYPKLFPTLMQGEQTESSVIKALDKIYQHQDAFDVVAIIRGGGATSDLSSFDSYLLAANCAQFPLPIITGIGHERDDTVLDIVAYHRAKTPTAVADFLIENTEETCNELMDLEDSIISGTTQILNQANQNLQNLSIRIPNAALSLLEKQFAGLELYKVRLQHAVKNRLNEAESQLKEKEAFIKLSSPEYILAKGYSITLKNGKAVKNAADLKCGDRISTKLSKGEIQSIVE
ncbi:MAG: exodeoxyribonuclease VII large subunit [Dysgonamonadaceae bacterium]|jgi:exodeoxyribonuclease VII large subunit|nr:exodeoxyribonuclease VII large subunit [Dysgonamonadaceae bacterium]